MSLNSYLSTMNTSPTTFLETEGKPKLSLMDGSCHVRAHKSYSIVVLISVIFMFLDTLSLNREYISKV